MHDFLNHPQSVRPGEELDVARLEAFLSQHFSESSGPVTVEQFPSGHSNLTYLVHFADRDLVLRRPPFGSKVKTAHDMGREYRVLSKLHSAYSPAPKALLYCDDQSVIGAPFYVMESVRGIIIRRDPPAGLPFPPATARSLSESFIGNLVRLHSLDYEAIGLGGLGKPQGYMERQVRGWTERYHGSKTHDFPEVERISEWLKEAMPSTRTATLIHNDYKYDNVVLDPADITNIVGVLDWEMSTIGDPLADLGTTLTYWIDPKDPEELQNIRWCPSTYPGTLSREQLVDHYARKTGCDVSRIVFYLVFARFKLAVIDQQIYYRYHQGLTKDSRFAALPTAVRTLLRAALYSAQSNSL